MSNLTRGLFKNYTQVSQSWKVILFSALILLNILNPSNQLLKTNQAEAANNVSAAPVGTNLLKGNSFESDINSYWVFWNNSARNISSVRSYDPAYGQGSYSLSIQATGRPAGRTDAGMVTSNANAFLLQPNKTYVLRFYAKASTNLQISAMLEDANTYAGNTPVVANTITTDWQQYNILFTPSMATNTASLLTFFYGDLPEGASLNLDGLTLLEDSYKLSTTEVKGYIGDIKSISLNNLSMLSENDIDVELPYYDNLTSQTTFKKIKPSSINGNNLNFILPVGSFSGLGKVYVLGGLAGQFDYNVVPKIIELYPTMLRADQALSLKVSGFNPSDGNSFVVVHAINLSGKPYEVWLKPDSFDSQLSYVTVKLPIGVSSGGLYMQTSFQNLAGKVIENKTSSISYKVMPIIYQLEWSAIGFEQAGDKIKIHGKGISNNPIVNFYDQNHKIVASKKASVVGINSTEEVIEVVSVSTLTDARITVTVDGVESDVTSSLAYLAKPKLSQINSKNQRVSSGSGEKLPAAKIGEEITVSGSAFNYSTTSPVMVEFQGNNQRFSVAIDNSKVSSNGSSLKVTVPSAAQTGFVSVISNGKKSNYLPLEIIPKLVSFTPNPIVPGSNMTINAQGVGNNLALLKVVFNLTNQEKVEVAASSISVNDTGAVIVLQAPLAISNKYSSINLKYDRWQDDGAVNLNVQPTITSANINLDDSTLVIQGYGFSINPNENLITYKYADTDHTMITPRVQMLGVYPTEDGQEIRIKILDNYHYGYVSVKTGNYSSNEANFGPVAIKKIVRRTELVASTNQIMGVLYIYGYNFDSTSDVKVGNVWADVLSRSEFFIKAVVDKNDLYKNPVIVTKTN